MSMSGRGIVRQVDSVTVSPKHELYLLEVFGITD